MRMRLIITCGLLACTVVFHISHKLHDFRENVTEYKMCVLISSTTFVLHISHSEDNWARYDQNVCGSSCTVPYCCQILIKLEFCQHIFEKYCNIKFMDYPSSGNRVCPFGQTDNHDEATSRLGSWERPSPIFPSTPEPASLCFKWSNSLRNNIWSWTAGLGLDTGTNRLQAGDISWWFWPERREKCVTRSFWIVSSHEILLVGQTWGGGGLRWAGN